jgi:hypothetical protein
MPAPKVGVSRFGRVCAALLGAALVAGNAVHADRPAPSRIRVPGVGQPLPAARLRTLAGELLTFEELRGKAVWIAFFHSS